MMAHLSISHSPISPLSTVSATPRLSTVLLLLNSFHIVDANFLGEEQKHRVAILFGISFFDSLVRHLESSI